MKKTAIVAAMLLSAASLSAQDPQGHVSYSLPRTVLNFEVSARQEVFHAGPYAKYAKKYLGIDVREEDQTTYSITSVKLIPQTEADQSSRFSLMVDPEVRLTFLQMTSQGLVAGQPGTYSEGSDWKFTTDSKGNFTGIPSNLTVQSTTLHSKKGIVQQNTVVEKTPEKKAQEVAEMIFKIRDNRYKILVGDTDATYSGEAMKATIDELSRMENEYMTLFTGYSEYQDQTASFEVVPDNARQQQIYPAFRLSDTEGLVAPDNMTGKPYYVELFPEKVATPATDGKKGRKPDQEITYRIPAACTAKLSEGAVTVLQTRVAVYQLGQTTTYPLYKQK